MSCFEVTSWAEPRAKIQGSNAETLSDENLLSLYLASHTSPRHLPPPGFSDILLRNELDEFIHTEWGVECRVQGSVKVSVKNQIANISGFGAHLNDH